MLTISFAVFMSPTITYLLRANFDRIYFDARYFAVTVKIYACQTVADPILFVLALDPLRAAFLRYLRFCPSPAAEQIQPAGR
ncbi:hypothetical protein BV898_05461 [Hypsibius exemplaris]|uniref:G-protein coupled receptors family 1 profile domain-containing protein n=1 Tax=Hypsibius exemplaris TaxID=2072580 RepID=A0A1W0WZK6_HYPEX|nr:hypothetical protein BV898_05461 [Hypsibius exemplaris]